MPFFGDQPFWGQRVHALGAGSRPIPQKKLTVEKLSKAIKDVISSPHIRRKTEELGEKIRNEDGIGNAITMVEEIMKNA